MGRAMRERAEFCVQDEVLLAKPYHYKASGLDNITLLNGVTTQDTPYGSMVTIENIHGLHRAIALTIIEKGKPMTGAEFRFLRKQMGLSQRELAKRMRATGRTVANYERSKGEGGPAEMLMRMTYLFHVVPEATRAEVLKTLTDQWGTGGGGRAKLPDPARRKVVQRWREGNTAAA
jgi:transcriptional regulator with XRE-family HTH domain